MTIYRIFKKKFHHFLKTISGLASGLSHVQVDKHGITILITYISVDLAHHDIFRAKIGKGGINVKQI